MPSVTMTVKQTSLTEANKGEVLAESVNGAIQGTLRVTASKAIVKSVDPGDQITVIFQKA